MSARVWRTGALALLLLALGAGCNPVDTREALADLSQTCVPEGQCADGFTCIASKCYLKAGETCDDRFASEPCTFTLGVCASAQRQCVNGKLALTCPEADYGPDFQAVQETRCDGLDNDCDGVVDQGRPRPSEGLSVSSQPPGFTRLAPFGAGYLAVFGTRPTTGTGSAGLSLRARALDAQFKPIGTSDILLTDAQAIITRIQVLPFPGGAFVLWTNPFTGNPPPPGIPRIARVDVGPDGLPVIGLSARPPPIDVQDERFRGALSADGERLLLAWPGAQGTGLKGRLFDRALEPRSAVQQLSAALGDEADGPLDSLDVSAEPGGGFVAGWSVNASVPATRRVRSARFDATLQRDGAVVGLAEPAPAPSLRVLGAARSGGQPAIAWVAATSPLGLRHGLPFAAGATPSAPRETATFLFELERGAGDEALLAYTRISGNNFGFTSTLWVRRVSPDNSATERNLTTAFLTPSLATFYQGVNGVPWTVALTGSTGGLATVTACSL